MRTLNKNKSTLLSHPLKKTCQFNFTQVSSVHSDRAIETQDKVNSWDRRSIWTEQLHFTEKNNKISQKVRWEIKCYKQKERRMKQHEKSKLLVLVI